MPAARMHADLPVSSDAPVISPRRALLILAACLLTAPAFAQRGAMTIPRNLDQLADRASDIVRGTVVEARVEKHPELTALETVVVTLKLKETLKGDAQGRFTFRQYLWDARDVHDAAGYRKGQDLILLMVAPSPLGLSSPAGMGQGRFQVRRDRAGREMAVNATGNAQLFAGLADARPAAALTQRQAGLVDKHRGGPLAAADLTALIRAYVADE